MTRRQKEDAVVEIRRKDGAVMRVRQNGGVWVVTLQDAGGRELGRLRFSEDDSAVFENGKETNTWW